MPLHSHLLTDLKASILEVLEALKVTNPIGLDCSRQKSQRCVDVLLPTAFVRL
jgi:hypothetical protein